MIARARARTDVPVAVGFGIGTPEQAAAAAAAGADGVIVGTRLVRAAGESRTRRTPSASWWRASPRRCSASRSDRIAPAMAVIITATAGLCLWIILWSLNISGFDAILIAIVMVLIALAVRNVGAAPAADRVVTSNSWALARRGVACVAAAAMLAGCGTSSSSSRSSVDRGRSHADDLHQRAAGIAIESVAAGRGRRRASWRSSRTRARSTTIGLRLLAARKPKISDNARAAIQDTSAIAYLGELAPGATEQTVGITNALDLLQVSPTDTALELTQSTPAVPGAPSKYYESLSTYGHTFARVVPSSEQEAAFDAQAIAAAGGPVYIANDGSDYGRALAHALSQAAPNHKLTVSASVSGARAIFYAAASPAAAARFLNAAATSNPRAQLFGPSALYSPALHSRAVGGGPQPDARLGPGLPDAPAEQRRQDVPVGLRRDLRPRAEHDRRSSATRRWRRCCT